MLSFDALRRLGKSRLLHGDSGPDQDSHQLLLKCLVSLKLCKDSNLVHTKTTIWNPISILQIALLSITLTVAHILPTYGLWFQELYQVFGTRVLKRG